MKVVFEHLTDGQAALLVGMISAASLAIGGGITSIIAFFKDKGVAKREVRRLAIEAAFENWRHQNLLKIEMAKTDEDFRTSIDAPDAYIVHMLRIINIAADMNLTAYDAANRIVDWSSGAIDSDGTPRPKKDTEQAGASDGEKP